MGVKKITYRLPLRLQGSGLVVGSPVRCINRLMLRNIIILFFCGGRETERKIDWRVCIAWKDCCSHRLWTTSKSRIELCGTIYCVLKLLLLYVNIRWDIFLPVGTNIILKFIIIIICGAGFIYTNYFNAPPLLLRSSEHN